MKSVEIQDTAYYQYAVDVCSGKQTAGELIRLACRRFLDDCERDDLAFDREKVSRFFDFCSLFRHYKTTDCDSLGKRFVLEPWQQWVMANLIGFLYKSTGKRRFNTAMLCLARKQGKALALDTPIPTPTGYTTMGELREGDMVIGGDGKPCRVTYATEIQYGRTCYEVTFSDGEVITADADHNWYVKARRGRRAAYEVLTTKQMLDEPLKNRYQVPVCKPVEYSTKDLPVDPYTLWVWIACGESDTPRFMRHADMSVFERISSVYGPYKVISDNRVAYTNTLHIGKCKYDSDFFMALKSANLLHNKHIPEIYLRADIEQRLALLQGMLDCDGTIRKDGICCISYVDMRIADALCELLGSLGVKYQRHDRPGRHAAKDYKIAANIYFKVPRTYPIMTVQSKLDKLPYNVAERSMHKAIKSIKPVESVPVRCITVDSPDHTYLCGKHYTVTHNTALSAVICLWFFFDEAGASVGLAANSRSQASLAFDFVSKFASQIDPKQKSIRRYRNSLKCPANSGDLKVFAADATRLDGENLSFALIDEYHAAKDNSVYAVLRSSMTSRPNPLILVISTVGFNLSGPMRKMYDTDIEILHGVKTDDNRFSAIYQMDELDDWEDEKNWIKHSPNLGVSVSYDNLRKAKVEAINNPATLNETLTKNWNMWRSVSECWIPDNYILPCMTKHINLDDYAGWDAYIGVDLSCVSDMTAVSVMLTDEERYIYKTYYYLPESCLVESPNREMYKEWVRTKQLTVTPGNVVDYDYITNDIMRLQDRLNIQKVAYDQYNSTSWAIKCTELGLPLQPYSQSIGNFNKPTKEMERQIRSGIAEIDNNEITLWCFRNVEIKTDWNANSKPVKVHADRKIDGVIAMVEALGVWQATPHYSGSIYTV